MTGWPVLMISIPSTRFPPATPPRRFNSDSLAAPKPRAEFPRHLFDRAAVADHAGFSRRARLSASQSPWTARAPLGQQRHFTIGQHFNLAHNSIATAMHAFSAAIWPK